MAYSGNTRSVPSHPDSSRTTDDCHKENDDQTVKLVQAVKAKLREQLKEIKTITESDVAFVTSDVKREMKLCGDMEQVKKSTIKNDSNLNDLFDLSTAYGNHETDIVPIFEKEKRRFKNDSNSYPKRRYVENSLDNIISPLQKLKRRGDTLELKNLFIEIQRVRKRSTLCADRMFYIEAKNLVSRLKAYTIENAHDQVQAICLMHFKPESDDGLVNFITNCRTFESAYSHLQNLATGKSRAERRPSFSRTTGGDSSRLYPDHNAGGNRPSAHSNQSCIQNTYNQTGSEQGQWNRHSLINSSGGATTTRR